MLCFYPFYTLYPVVRNSARGKLSSNSFIYQKQSKRKFLTILQKSTTLFLNYSVKEFHVSTFHPVISKSVPQQKQSSGGALWKRCSSKFCKIHRKTVCWVSFTKVAELVPATLLIKRLQHRCFNLRFAKLIITPFLQNTSDDCFWMM